MPHLGICILLLLAGTSALAQTYDVGPFPKHDPASAFAALKILDGGDNPLRSAREDWSAARARAASDPAWARWVDERRAELDDWMAHRRDRVEWVAGWWHDFVSPKDGSFLIWTPDEPGPATLASPSDPRVELTPKIHGGWVFGFRTRHTDKVADAARLYRLTGEPRYAEWAAAQLDFYADNYTKWPLQTSKAKARLMHQSLDDATVLIRLVTAARLLEGFVPPQRKRNWIDRLFRPSARLLDETFQRIHNIACWQRTAMALTALYAEDAELWKQAIDGPFGIRKQVAHGVTSEYLWFEQSMGYNRYVVSALLPLFTMASLEGRAGELREEMLVIQNMMLAPIVLRFPNGRLPNPADAAGGASHAPDERFLAGAYRLFPTTLGLRHIAGQRTWDTLVDPPPPAPPPAPLPEPASLSLPSSRMALLRQGPWQVFFHYGQLNASHAQAEALNFEATYRGIAVTLDPGTVGYGSPLHRGFYTTGAAHNVPLVDGQGQGRWQPGELLHFSPSSAAAQQPDYRPGVSAERELRLVDGRLEDVVRLKVEGSEPRRLGQVLHLHGRILAPPEAGPVEPPLPHWSETRRAHYRDRAVVEAVFAGFTLVVAIETAGPFTVTFGRSPDSPPGLRESLYIEKLGTSAEFRLTLAEREPAPLRRGTAWP